MARQDREGVIAADVVVHIVEDQVAGPPSNPMDTGMAIEPQLRARAPDLLIGPVSCTQLMIGAPVERCTVALMARPNSALSGPASAAAAPPPTRHNQHAESRDDGRCAPSSSARLDTAVITAWTRWVECVGGPR